MMAAGSVARSLTLRKRKKSHPQNEIWPPIPQCCCSSQHQQTKTNTNDVIEHLQHASAVGSVAFSVSAEAVGRHCKRQLFALAVGVRFGDDFGGVVVRQACWQGASSGNVKSKREKKKKATKNH